MVIASIWSWVTKTVVVLSRWCSSLISARICTRSLASRFDERLVEQEHLRVAHDRPAHRHPLPLPARELPRIALEIAARARGSPPPARPAPRPRPCRCAAASARSPCSAAPSCAGRARSSGTPSRCRARPAAGCSPPARRCGSCPPVMLSSPAIIRSSVDLPQPDGPTSTANSPSSISRSTPWITWTGPIGLPEVADRDPRHVSPSRPAAGASRLLARIPSPAGRALSTPLIVSRPFASG